MILILNLQMNIIVSSQKEILFVVVYQYYMVNYLSFNQYDLVMLSQEQIRNCSRYNLKKVKSNWKILDILQSHFITEFFV